MLLLTVVSLLCCNRLSFRSHTLGETLFSPQLPFLGYFYHRNQEVTDTESAYVKGSPVLEALESAGQVWWKLSLSREGTRAGSRLQCSSVMWGNLPGKLPAGAAPGGHPCQPASWGKPVLKRVAVIKGAR